MTAKGNTLHFINRVDPTNCGDSMVTPLIYYSDYFSQYRLLRHDILSIDYDRIDETDIVIFGGGGLLNYSESMNLAVNRVLDSGATVIAWSPGFNSHSKYKKCYVTEINYDKFALLTVRDYNNAYGLPYLPDVTCKLAGLKKRYKIKREYGIARHKDYPILGFNFETITNFENIDSILRFIGESETVISNSYHILYWSLLMEKKVICANPFSDKFYGYKYKPVYYPEDGSLEECAEKARKYNILEESIRETDDFFQMVRKIVEQKLKPVAGFDHAFETMTELAALRTEFRRQMLHPGDEILSQLFFDMGTGYSEEQKVEVINNIYGADRMTAHFDLAEREQCIEMRFDPIEGFYCEVEILSACDGQGEVTLTAKESIQSGNWYQFITTDPHFFIDRPCREYLDIQFRLRVLDRRKIEELAWTFGQKYDYLQQQLTTEHQNIAKRDQVIADYMADIATKNAQLTCLEERILTEQQNVAERDKVIADCMADRVKKDEQLACLKEDLQELNSIHQDDRLIIMEQRRQMDEQAKYMDQMTHSILCPGSRLRHISRDDRKRKNSHDDSK